MEVKRELYNLCLENINKRVQTIEKRLNDMVEARNSETKCVVGDKHETGRTMMHLEEEKSRMQYYEIDKELKTLLKIDIDKGFNNIEAGCLVSTTNGIYFISIGIGKVVINQENYYCVSQTSPIGLLLIGKTIGDKITFNNNTFTIKDIN